MPDEFIPIDRSQIWLAEKADSDDWQAQGQDIERRLAGFGDSELLNVALDAEQPSRIRWIAACKLTGESKQLLADELVQRDDDPWWTTAAKLWPPTRNERTMAALKRHLDSHVIRSRRGALIALSQLGDDSIAADVEELLRDNDKYKPILAINCLALRNSDRTLAVLSDYVSCDSNPLAARVEAAKQLLRLGHEEVLSFLFTVARESKDDAAYYAAVAIQHFHDRTEAFHLFKAILTSDHPAAPHIALHVATEMGAHQLGFEADSLDRTRQWLATQLE